jgi:hypothetical protein
MSGMVEAVIGVVVAIFIIVIGIWTMASLYATNPLGTVIGIIVLLIGAGAIVAGFIRSNT